MKRKGEIIDLGIDGVTAEKSPDGQARVCIKINKRMLEGELNSSTYRRGKELKPDALRPASNRSRLIGTTLSNHDGVQLVILQSVRGAYINLDLEHPMRDQLLRVIAREMLEFGREFEGMLRRRAQLIEILSQESPNP